MKISPTEGHFNASLATIFLMRGEREPALEQFKWAAQKNPGNARINLSLGRTYVELGRYREAEQPLRRAVKLKPRNAEALKQLALLLYHHLGEKKEATDYLKLALALQPNMADAAEINKLISK